MYNKYDNECIVYLSIEILKMLLLEEQPILIDIYYKKILEIYEDYKKHDNNKKSLLDSIHDYINSNEKQILNNKTQNDILKTQQHQ